MIPMLKSLLSIPTILIFLLFGIFHVLHNFLVLILFPLFFVVYQTPQQKLLESLCICAERVTVVVLCVCMSVTHTLFWQYARLKV